MAQGRAAANKMPCNFGSAGFCRATVTVLVSGGGWVTTDGATVTVFMVAATNGVLATDGACLDKDNPMKIPAAANRRMMITGASQLPPLRQADSTGDSGGGLDGGLCCRDCLVCLSASLIRLIRGCLLQVRGWPG